MNKKSERLVSEDSHARGQATEVREHDDQGLARGSAGQAGQLIPSLALTMANPADIVTNFLLNAPPGEFHDVVTGAFSLLCSPLLPLCSPPSLATSSVTPFVLFLPLIPCSLSLVQP